MKHSYTCNKCGYRWEAEKAKYCLNCHSETVETTSHPKRTARVMKKALSNRKARIHDWLSKKRETSSNFMTDLWHGSRTLLFVVLIFFLLLALLFFLSSEGFV